VLQEKVVIITIPVKAMTSGEKYKRVQWVEGNRCRVGWRGLIHGICIM
jgi:hypothetical protein